MVSGSAISNIINKARKVGKEVGYFLVRKVMHLVFDRSELANSRGQGLQAVRDGDIRPALDKMKVKIVKGL